MINLVLTLMMSFVSHGAFAAAEGGGAAAARLRLEGYESH